MRLCPDVTSTPDALDCLVAVTAFLRAALCGERERPWDDHEALWGAELVFDCLTADLEELRRRIVQG